MPHEVARAAEGVGFDAIFNTEVNSDTMATAQLMGSVTSRIQVGTWIANIYLRHPYVCAKGAALIADDTGVRPWGVASSPASIGADAAPQTEGVILRKSRYVRCCSRWHSCCSR